MTPLLLDIQHVTRIFSSGFFGRQRVMAVDGVSLALPTDRAMILTIAGESGSGKTTLAQMVLGFLRPSGGHILFDGQDVQKMDAGRFLTYRRQVQAILQNPFDAFNPFYRVDHVFDTVINSFHLARGTEERGRIVREVLDAVRLVPEETLGRYPHQLSGGQLQRVMIARALLLKPRIIVADEPVSMIDVSLRAIILDILMNLKERFGISLVYITHDLSTALQISDEILIMYKGTVVERGGAASVIRNPKHPYTQLLVKSIPVPDPRNKWSDTLKVSPHSEESSGSQAGCKFHGRCPVPLQPCPLTRPSEIEVEPGHTAACFQYPADTTTSL